MAKNNKKTAGIIVAVVAGVVALAVALFFILKGGISAGEQVVTYKGNVSGMETTLTYWAKGDRVYKQTSKSVIPYSILGVDSAEAAKELVGPALEKAQGLEGYTDEVEYTDDAIIETVSVDFEVVDIDKLSELNVWLMKEGDVSAGISLSKSAEYLEQNGFTKVDE